LQKILKPKIMDVIIMENKAYQELMAKLEQIHEFFRSFSQAKEDKECKESKENKDVWLDSKAVCERLNISTRTLYRLRKERVIGYSNVRGHYRFKQSDVEQILNGRLIVPNPETFDEMRQTL
jgi:excisionase family DNA binding protein